jgi:hypothetical protein
MIPDAHVMIDLETLGVGDDAAIIQIGAVRFWPDEGEAGLISSPEGSFRSSIRIKPDDFSFGRIEEGTLTWWFEQSPDAQRRVLCDPERVDHVVAFSDLAAWLAQGKTVALWANSPSFDIRLLRQAFTRNDVDVDALPRYSRERDFRTLRKVVGEALAVEEPLRVGVAHDALDDAYHQAGHAIRILRRLRQVGQM